MLLEEEDAFVFCELSVDIVCALLPALLIALFFLSCFFLSKKCLLLVCITLQAAWKVSLYAWKASVDYPTGLLYSSGRVLRNFSCLHPSCLVYLSPAVLTQAFLWHSRNWKRCLFKLLLGSLVWVFHRLAIFTCLVLVPSPRVSNIFCFYFY